MIAPPATWCMYYRGVTPAPKKLVDVNIIGEEYRKRLFAYPMAYGKIQRFADMYEWRFYLQSLRLRPEKVPLAYIDAFDEALRALFMAYALPELSKLGEMKAFATLEGALLMAYEHKMCTEKEGRHRCVTLARILEWASVNDSLPAEWYRESLAKRSRSDLHVIRNKQMHGALLEETMPWGGLFNAVKKIIEHAYRNHPQYDVHRERLVFQCGTREAVNDLDYVPPPPCVRADF